MKLSEHFDLEKFIISQTAIRNNIDNTPSQEIIDSLKSLCEHVLEPMVKDGLKFNVSSGYRCLQLNKKIGGAKNSQHTKGQAADLTPIGMTTEEFYQSIIKLKIPFDQIIQEFNSWVHVSFATPQRGQKLRATKSNGKTIYTVDNNTY